MSELTLQIISGLKILLVAVFAFFYSWGGLSGKWKRRFIAPAVYTAGICGLSVWQGTFNYWYILCAFLLMGALSIGYGGDDLKTKIVKRSRYGLACSVGALPLFILSAAWTLLGLHVLTCVLFSVVCGVWNQTSSARAEETLIGASLVLIPTFIV